METVLKEGGSGMGSRASRSSFAYPLKWERVIHAREGLVNIPMGGGARGGLGVGGIPGNLRKGDWVF
jgi:hypothetical protein